MCWDRLSVMTPESVQWQPGHSMRQPPSGEPARVDLTPTQVSAHFADLYHQAGWRCWLWSCPLSSSCSSSGCVHVRTLGPEHSERTSRDQTDRFDCELHTLGLSGVIAGKASTALLPTSPTPPAAARSQSCWCSPPWHLLRPHSGPDGVRPCCRTHRTTAVRWLPPVTCVSAAS